MTRRRIDWIEEERKAVGVEWALLRLLNPFELAGVLLKQAQQKVLLPGRQRPDLQFVNDPKTKAVCEQEFRELTSDTKFEPVIVEREVERPIDVKKILDSVSAVELRAYIENRLQQEMIEQIIRAVRAEQSTLTHKTSENNSHPLSIFQTPQQEPREKKFRVAVIGVVKAQSREMESRLPDDVDVRYIDKSKGLSTNSFPTTCDACIIWKADHKWTHFAEKQYGNQNVHFLKGGVLEIVKRIMELRSVWIAKQSGVKNGHKS